MGDRAQRWVERPAEVDAMLYDGTLPSALRIVEWLPMRAQVVQRGAGWHTLYVRFGKGNGTSLTAVRSDTYVVVPTSGKPRVVDRETFAARYQQIV